MKQGELLKKLGKERNLSQKSLTQDPSSRSTLSSMDDTSTSANDDKSIILSTCTHPRIVYFI